MDAQCNGAMLISGGELIFRCTKPLGHEGNCSVTIEIHQQILVHPTPVEGTFAVCLIDEDSEKQITHSGLSFVEAHRLKLQLMPTFIGNSFSRSVAVVEESVKAYDPSE